MSPKSFSDARSAGHAGQRSKLAWNTDGSSLLEGSQPRRKINRKLCLSFSLDGPKTRNGLMIEHFREIPEAGVSLKTDGISVEIGQTQDRSVKIARLFKPEP